MIKYRVEFFTGASYLADVEAEDKDDAEDKAFEDIPSLCHHCADIELGEWEVSSVEEVNDS